jgi:hypothetical protein
MTAITRTIVSHDTATGKARIRFSDGTITMEHDYDLIYVVPGTKQTLEKTNTPFDETMQQNVIDTLTRWKQAEFDNGIAQSNLDNTIEHPPTWNQPPAGS